MSARDETLSKFAVGRILFVLNLSSVWNALVHRHREAAGEIVGSATIVMSATRTANGR